VARGPFSGSVTDKEKLQRDNYTGVQGPYRFNMEEPSITLLPTPGIGRGRKGHYVPGMGTR